MKTKVITFNLMYKYKGNDKITIDLCNPPENLEELVTEAFHSYTEWTAKDYRDEDRLRFIDVIRKSLVITKTLILIMTSMHITA